MHKKINSVFEQVKQLIQLVLVSPITSNTTEKSFNKLKLLLASTLSTMRDDRLNHLALRETHRNRLASVTTDFIINKFKEQPRHAKILADTVTEDEDGFYWWFFYL